jgi:hypothetical protein
MTVVFFLVSTKAWVRLLPTRRIHDQQRWCPTSWVIKHMTAAAWASIRMNVVVTTPALCLPMAPSGCDDVHSSTHAVASTASSRPWQTIVAAATWQEPGHTRSIYTRSETTVGHELALAMGQSLPVRPVDLATTDGDGHIGSNLRWVPRYHLPQHRSATLAWLWYRC